jgi:UDP-N-acetyl-D-glucosamine dehydrogenase
MIGCLARSPGHLTSVADDVQYSPLVFTRGRGSMKELLRKIADRSARVGVIGQGYVGLPLALVFQQAGFQVVGFDLDSGKVAALNRGESYIKHIGADRVARAVESGRFAATTDFDRLRDCDAIFICVPTPLGKHREPDNGYIWRTAEEIAPRLRKGQVVVLESTTYPGTTDGEVLPILEKSGLKCPADFFLAFSPEREDPGNPSFHTRIIPKVVGGVNGPSSEAAVALYSAALDKVVPVSSSRVAESAKLLENIFRSVNIALVNELKMTFDRMGIDVWEVIEAAKTKPFGYTPFYPGPGLGGHCIPLDPFYLTWKAAEYGEWTRFIELAGEVNTSMPSYVVRKTIEALNDNGKAIRGARVLVLGLSYKADIDDDRESPAYVIIEKLLEYGALVSYCDPYFPTARATRKYDIGMKSTALSAAEFSRFDVILVLTAHREFRDPALYSDVRLVVDSRNLMAGIVGLPAGLRVVKA